VNAEQASKFMMQEPTRRGLGKADEGEEYERTASFNLPE
jgi:hypothetical protein